MPASVYGQPVVRGASGRRPKTSSRSSGRSSRSQGREASRGSSRTVGHYLLGKTIGEGTFGKVKAGTHILTNEKVAIKILEKSRIVEIADVQRVAREIKILKRNLHSNVIQLFEVLDTPTTIYLIMENADRGEMFDYIVSCQRVPEREACYFFHQIIDGVDYLHSIEVTHRDLKPENLLLQSSEGGDLIVKIVDFGLSNTHDGGRKLRTACGSPCYAAPEMIAGKAYEGPKADIWSVGVILFALVCGYLPFEDQNTSQLYKKILAGDYSIPKWVSKDVRDLITKILNTDPEKRYSIEDIRAHPWYKQISMPKAPSMSGPEINDLDEEAINMAGKLGLNTEVVKESVLNGAHNNSTTTYHLLSKRLQRLRQAHQSEEAQEQTKQQLLQQHPQQQQVLQPAVLNDAQVVVAFPPPRQSRDPFASGQPVASHDTSKPVHPLSVNPRPQVPRLRIRNTSNGGTSRGGSRGGSSSRGGSRGAAAALQYESKTARIYRPRPTVRTANQPASARLPSSAAPTVRSGGAPPAGRPSRPQPPTSFRSSNHSAGGGARRVVQSSGAPSQEVQEAPLEAPRPAAEVPSIDNIGAEPSVEIKEDPQVAVFPTESENLDPNQQGAAMEINEGPFGPGTPSAPWRLPLETERPPTRSSSRASSRSSRQREVPTATGRDVWGFDPKESERPPTNASIPESGVGSIIVSQVVPSRPPGTGGNPRGSGRPTTTGL